MNLLLHPRTEQSIKMFLSKPSHAVGLSGTAGAGKDYLSWRIASELLGISIEQAKKHSQIFVIDVEAEDGIERVRELQSFLHLKVIGNKTIQRCVIIRHIEKLRPEAQNALLKTLEEPPTDTVIICTVSGSQSVLPTIASRLQWINVLPISSDQATAGFSAYPEAQIARAYHVSGGNVGLLKALLEESDDHPMSLAITQAKSILQASSYERLTRVEAIVKDKEHDVSSLLDALYKLLHAATAAAVKKSTAHHSDIMRLNQQTASVLRAQKLLENRTQPKLVLTWLFYSL